MYSKVRVHLPQQLIEILAIAWKRHGVLDGPLKRTRLDLIGTAAIVGIMRALWALIWQAAAVGSFLCRRPFPLPGRVDSPRRSAAHSERALSRASLVKVLPTRRSSFGPYGRSDSWLIQAASDPLSASKLELDAPLRENSNLLRGSLDNGLQYLVLPVRGAAAEHASVQLEVLSGSASEAEQQQGLICIDDLSHS